MEIVKLGNCYSRSIIFIDGVEIRICVRLIFRITEISIIIIAHSLFLYNKYLFIRFKYITTSSNLIYTMHMNQIIICWFGLLLNIFMAQLAHAGGFHALWFFWSWKHQNYFRSSLACIIHQLQLCHPELKPNEYYRWTGLWHSN